MRRILRSRLLAGALALGTAPLAMTIVPACAQMEADVGFDSFHDQLAPYGYWLYSDRWGLVWQPSDVPPDFRPYFTNGHWVDTDEYGWTWASNYEWGDIPFHYGRWVDDPEDGWLWIPGYTWSPGWVVWHSNDQYVGWMPAPPDQAFLQGQGDVSVGVSLGFGGVSFNFNNDPYYGYRTWYPDYDDQRFAANWVFVGYGHVADVDYRPFVIGNPVQVVNIIHETRDITNYTIINNYVVNKSVDVHLVERAGGRSIVAIAAQHVFRHPNLIATVDVGHRAAIEARVIAPHGFGIANSAPKPSARVVEKLSVQATPRNGHPFAHLFTRATVATPEAQNRFHGSIGQGQPNKMTGPNGAPEKEELTRHREEIQPNGMTGPNSTMAPNSGSQTPQIEEMKRHQEEIQPNGMTGPNGANGPPQLTRHREEAQPGTTSGPAGGNPGGTKPQEPDLKQHTEQQSISSEHSTEQPKAKEKKKEEGTPPQ